MSQQWSYAFFVRGFGCALFILEKKLMIITFCGHSDYTPTKQDEKKLLDILEEKVGDLPADLYLGGYGSFDQFALVCGRKYRALHPLVKLYFISPYLTEQYHKNRLREIEHDYDGIIFPPLETVPGRYAILHRNRWMIERADLLISHVTRSFGGARQTLDHARRKKKDILEL